MVLLWGCAGAAASSAPAIPGTSVLTGKVTADAPFAAAQVYARDLDLTREGAIIFSTRSSNQAGLGVFYPDVSKITGYGAYR